MNSGLEKYYAQRVKHLGNHLLDFETSLEEELLHEFRVELKKMRALIKFLQKIHGKAAVKKTKELLDLVFHTAGTLREFQLIRNWLLANRLTGIEAKFSRENLIPANFGHFFSGHPGFAKKLQQALHKSARLIEKTGQDITDKYAEELKKNILEKINALAPASSWHSIRKLLKQWIYACNWTSLPEQAKNRTLKNFSQLQEAIGIWHDNQLLSNYFASIHSAILKDPYLLKEWGFGTKKINTALKSSSAKVLKLLKNLLLN
ncbi:MAG: hypothetical protein RLZZ28_930 [Bacteroidota bacterium]|jgi:CHAD domain-containing protein